MKRSNFLLLLVSALSCLADAASAAITEQTIAIPIAKNGNPGSDIQLTGIEYKPEGNGPFPLLVINHGSPRSSVDRPGMKPGYQAQARYFAEHGFVVITPMRRGYGKSGGNWAEDFFSCDNPAYYDAGREGAKDIAAAISYEKARSYVDGDKIVLLGHSAGGFASLALSSQNPPGVLGAVIFAAGRGSRSAEHVCGEPNLIKSFSRYAAGTHMPMLWFYSENDHFFGPAMARKFYAAYREKGVDVRFVAAPPYRDDGHGYVYSRNNDVPAWIGEVQQFLKKLGLPQQVQ
ncbi:alpha/beta hydrolase family protein [Herbaspirillum rhizosphaerae]|uniref:alpha/beta hydrolase family protein n=1 Tax=Herbaspirillum rhizosphaerae TaxID=346179 RepID=UPI0009F9E2EF|nr:alpha/beta fold hydrolase [Herbaspirillum rhizosphaerae]